MAIGKQGILGRLQGSLANLTLYNLGGQQVMRQKAVNVKNTFSAEREAYRDNMSFAITVFNELKPLLHYSLASRKKNQSLIGEFLRLTLNKSIKNSTIDYNLFYYFYKIKTKSPVVIDFSNASSGKIDTSLLL